MLSIRSATVDDLAPVVAIETGPDTARYLGVTGPEFHLRALADADQEHLVAEAGGAVVGFVVLAGLRTGAGRVELRRIVVSHGHRGVGHGRELFRAAVARAYRHHGAARVWLDVKPDNARARALYRSEGFTPKGTIPDPMDPTGVLTLMEHAPAALTGPPARPAGDR